MLCGCSTLPGNSNRTISRSLEFRYYSPSAKANGETDLKGKTAIFNTDQRLSFLNSYTDYASQWFNDPELDSKVATEKDVRSLIASIKPQPLPGKREVIRLKNWRSLGMKNGLIEKEEQSLKQWSSYAGAEVYGGVLKLNNGTINHKMKTLMDWRFEVKWRARVETKGNYEFALAKAGQDCVRVGFGENGRFFYVSNGKRNELQKYQSDKWYEFHVEVELQENEYNLYVNGERVAYGVKPSDPRPDGVDTFSIVSGAMLQFDSLYALNCVRQDDVEVPYAPELVIDQQFEVRPFLDGWTSFSYADDNWKQVALPYAHGGVRYAGEDLYLRRSVKVGRFEKAVLRVETLDPGGEIYVNGHKVAVVSDRTPVRVDVSKYLRSSSDNILALKVNHFVQENAMHHCCADHNIGWFAGRAALELSSAVSVERCLVHTAKFDGENAIQSHSILFENLSQDEFKGKVAIRYFLWSPKEGRSAAEKEFDLILPSGKSVEKSFSMLLEEPLLWNWDNPNLYKVQVVLKDSSGRIVDDSVLTTGVRTIAQNGDRFLVNGKDEMLNGVQNMGFRMPLETLARYNRCATIEQIAEELIMVRKCKANMLRIHVHSGVDISDGINDPRIPEMCDQLGIMLAWQTPSWVRAGLWEDMDLKNFKTYAHQVYNSPSIVDWELGNHPNKFKGKGLKYSTDFVEQVMNTVLAVDQSRLITPTTFWQHTLIKNDMGTLGPKGEKIKAPAVYTHPLCTRGTQDGVTGYGAEWSKLRAWPQGFTLDVLNNGKRAFFNWEHEESIAQPNWNLCKGKTWSKMHSYEHKYDKGSIGRELEFNEWRASQGFQAFAAYESMKKQRLYGIDGFSWCCLHGGANSGTYKKPIVDTLGHAKLAWHIHKLVHQRVLAGSDNVDIVYGPEDTFTPVIMNLDGAKTVNLKIIVRDASGQEIQRFTFDNIELEEGRNETRLKPVKASFPEEGCYAIEYIVE